MTAESCFECEGDGVTLFYPHVEALVLGGYMLFEDLSAGGWYQTECPYCNDSGDSGVEFFLLMPLEGPENA